MRALIVAPSAAPRDLKAEICKGDRPRLDYFELSDRLSAPYFDYESPRASYSPFIRAVEKGLRLDFYLARQIASTVKQNSADLVITLSERMGIPLAYMLGRHVKHITLSHKPLSPAKFQFIKAIRTFRHWNVMLTFSQAEAEVLQKAYRVGSERIRPLHWGVDTRYYSPLENSKPADGKDHIFSIGVSNRDYPTLIRAMRQLPHIECHICPTSAWETRGLGSEGSRLPGNIHIVKYDHPLAIREAYAKSRFVVIPMRNATTQWSAGCTSVLQPQAMGKPVIATHLPGLAEYLVNGETGMLVAGANPDLMARAIDDLWRNPEQAAAMGRRARQWVESTRSLESSIDQIVDIVDEIG